ncbi:hypothetical protein PHAVU_004G073350 [Phaseolus vulgaris]|uniref:Uncharacterized protein n=1 Tax=Phaseolus vulgaris TaxID=3885 RepID=V7CPU2_PHAVU|nr:hypothetical protein PHAVU_002G197100g [Phaseolus vulgaris]ESW30961.1 hypothetical protein PHAVU_002G197100g [Phaseolus vulgaris]
MYEGRGRECVIGSKKRDVKDGGGFVRKEAELVRRQLCRSGGSPRKVHKIFWQACWRDMEKQSLGDMTAETNGVVPRVKHMMVACFGGHNGHSLTSGVQVLSSLLEHLGSFLEGGGQGRDLVVSLT